MGHFPEKWDNESPARSQNAEIRLPLCRIVTLDNFPKRVFPTSICRDCAQFVDPISRVEVAVTEQLGCAEHLTAAYIWEHDRHFIWFEPLGLCFSGTAVAVQLNSPTIAADTYPRDPQSTGSHVD
jgi:hypothetical protein